MAAPQGNGRATRVPTAGWPALTAGRPWFRGEGAFPLPAYSEFTPPPRVVRRPYGTADADGFSPDDPHGWPVGEYEEELELRPGLHLLARELVHGLTDLARGKPAPALRPLLDDNPYWPAELAGHRGGFPHERCVLLLPLALSRTLDDKSRPTWTVFGGSEHGPARAFWRGFATGPDAAINSLAMKLSGIDKNFKVKEGETGFAEKDPVTGEPTGVLRHCSQYVKKKSSEKILHK